MIVAVAKEIKVHEYRVGLTPANAKVYAKKGHIVLVEKDAGLYSGYTNEDYEKAGAQIYEDKKAMFDKADMIIKVKEPQPSEYDLFHEGQILYTYLHLAADKPQAEALMKKKVKAVAYETMEEKGKLPCLNPMSEIAGRLSIQEGARFLERPQGGKGVLLGGIPGVNRGKVVVIGGGVVGINAAKMAVGMGAEVTILDINPERLAYLDDIFGGQVTTLYSTEENISLSIRQADLVVGAVLIPGAKAPHLIKKSDLKEMKPGSVIVDVAVDQGGCFETTKATNHDDPVFTIDGVVHYCVANMPGAVAITSTQALTGVTLKYGLMIADLGVEEAVRQNDTINKGLNVYMGHMTCPQVAADLDLPYTAFKNI
ncbi:alanine dehydrogenase [Spirochaeta cellobiosiphila]|uniref:alanine dehydrogenase n=1 Tax=Spirochaeta cellobiosiphila TaxID=504483 RepID=UPI0003F81875|nr:alanine dehydrogenase [Spirochaeta cellobiosiphila]